MKGHEGPNYAKKLKSRDILMIYDQFEIFYTQILNIFENKEFCRKYRLF